MNSAETFARAIEVVGILLIIGGIIMRYRINRRRYYKRFEPMKRVSFEKKWMGDFGDGFSEFLSIAFIVVGLVAFVLGWVGRDSAKAKKEAAMHHHTTTIP